MWFKKCVKQSLIFQKMCNAISNKKASALFQADAAEEFRVYQFFYKRKTTLKMIF